LSPVKNEEKLKYWAESILDGLAFIHEAGIIHCDLKLENILMSQSEVEGEYMIPKICDFGLSHVISRQDNKCYLEVLCGTKGYMAPE
jgi:serine/threonine protein kinase